MEKEFEALGKIKRVHLDDESSDRILSSVLSELTDSIPMRKVVSIAAIFLAIFFIEGLMLYRPTVNNNSNSIQLEDVNTSFYE